MSEITAIPGSFQSAISTIQRSVKKLDDDASVVATSAVDRPEGGTKDVVAALVDSRQQVLYTQAAAKIIRATDAMTKTLLDIHA
jgi:hypothetical protein